MWKAIASPAKLASAVALTVAMGLPAVAQAEVVIDEVVLFERVDMIPVTLASSIMKADINFADNTKLGRVSDILLNENHEMIGVSVGVGGFLGIDETYVVIPMSDITIEVADNRLVLASDITEETLRALTDDK